MKVKVCGITNLEDALYAVECGADAIGFVFYKKSKRYIEPSEAGKIISQMPPFIFSVGVFVNENQDFVNQIAKQIKLNAIQLHGDEDINYINKIKYAVIKGFRVSESFDWNILKSYRSQILLDTFSHNEIGGTGKSFNWDLIPSEIRSKIILSGGINVNSLPEIVNKIKPAAIDLSSSLELTPGKKDFAKIKLFFEKLRTYRS